MKKPALLRIALIAPLLALASCGGGGSGDDGPGFEPGNWVAGQYRASSTFAAQCANPRAGTSDQRGSATTENNFLRSWSHELYLWYRELPDLNPANYATPAYFDLLKTSQTTPSGQAKDQFHFTYPTTVWEQLSQSGIEAGYGAEFALLSRTPPRRIVVAFTQPGSTAATNLSRGDEIIQVDGADAVNGSTQAAVDALNAGLFPTATGQSHTFVVRNLAGTQRTVVMSSSNVTTTPVQNVTTFATASGPVGYMQFNDHIAPSEKQLVDAVVQLRNANVVDLILDLRYNGGGYLDIASELAYMIANPTMTSGKNFERMVFNDKYPNTNPITGQALTPTPFFTTSRGFVPSVYASGQALPNLALNRVYVITGSGTCSASESVINGLRGAGITVYQIGSRTCGKPYGFYAAGNCGTHYFSIQFRGENNLGFGDYADGFSAANQTGVRGVSVEGCSVRDDFTQPLGNTQEARIAAALAFRASNNQTCPTASGESPPPVLSKASVVDGNAGLALRKNPMRENRIIGE
jgi:carboxyl-terminal processing protease